MRAVHIDTTNQLERLRKERGLKRQHLAVEMDVDPSTVYRWETTGAIPDEMKLRLADYFDTTPAALMGWDREAA